MKRRTISFITVLALCLSLLPTRGLAADWGPDALDSAKIIAYADSDLPSNIYKHKVSPDTTVNGPHNITRPTMLDTCGYTYTATQATLLVVTDTGSLYLTTGTVKSEKEAGIEVQAGGSLYAESADMTVIGETYGLEVFSGATICLSGGTFTGKKAAIWAEGNEYAFFLKAGYAYFDENGDPLILKPVNIAGAKTVTVKECTEHSYTCTPTTGVPTHSRTCEYCGTKNTVPCTFRFDADGLGTCDDCKRTLKVNIETHKDSLIYDGTDKADAVTVEVILDGSEEEPLNEGTDYNFTVEPKPAIDADEPFTVTVVGEPPYDWTFTKTYAISKDTPVITWTATDSVTVNYEADQAALAEKVEGALLPLVNIEIQAVGDIGDRLLEELRENLTFSYKEYEGSSGEEEGSAYTDEDDAGFTGGLPTEAGTYQVKANLPETHNYNAASSGPITLVIGKINSLIKAPVATKPFYNGTAQELVTSGTAADGAEILFAPGTTPGKEPDAGEYSKTIPTGIDAGDYIVWYKVVGSDNNFILAGPESISSVKIRRKEITPVVQLEYDTCVYSGGFKEPKVTVIDPENWEELLPTEYKVTYGDNQNVGRASVTISDRDNKGNYKIVDTTVYFEITAADQDALTITGQPGKVCYGDTFTLGTSGGSGNGTVTWEIAAAKGPDGSAVSDFKNVAEIKDNTSGQITVKGLGSFTVRATKSGTDSGGNNNHAEATAEVTFRVYPKSVTAVVTAASKVYDGTADAQLTVKVPEQDYVASGDKITITKVTGRFSDANAGTNKTVAVDISEAKIEGDKDAEGYQKYTVTIPAAPVSADITRAKTEITTGTPTTGELTYTGDPQNLLLTAAAAAPTTTVTGGEAVIVEYALSEGGSYSTEIPQGADAGEYKVWYRVRESGNYIGTAAVSKTVTIKPKPVTAYVTLDKTSYVYDGTEKKPAVTVREGPNTSDPVIPSTEYTVAYSNNVNVGNNTATVTVTAREGGNYKFTNGTNGAVKETFTITSGGKAALTGSPQAKDLTYNGEPQDLVTVGTATGGHLEYSLQKTTGFDAKIPQETAAGTYTVYYKVVGDGNFEDSDVASVSVTIKPKTVSNPEITLQQLSANDAMYNGKEKRPSVISVKDGSVTIAGPNTAGETPEYTVSYSNNINAGTATVHINDVNGGNYNVSGRATFEITKATAKFADGKEPEAIANLIYNAKARTLITAGVAEGGTAVYSLGDENGPYLPTLPTGTDCGEYEVWAKVLGDSNHKDSTPIKIPNVKIGQNTVTQPLIELSSAQFQYNGSEQKPTVTVRDDDRSVIPANEYTVAYEDADGKPADTVNAGCYYIKITSKEINYHFDFKKDPEIKVTILPADQAPLEITGRPSIVYYGDTVQLSTSGGSGNGTVEWSIVTGETDGRITKGESEGQFIITGVGDITVKAVRTPAAGSGYDVTEATWTFHAFPKPVTAVVKVKDKDYDGTKAAELESVTVPGANIQITDAVTVEFADADVGTNKAVLVTGPSDEEDVKVTGGDADLYSCYAVAYPASTTASIKPADVKVKDAAGSRAMTDDDKPAIKSLKYSGGPQDLVSPGKALDGGTWVYSTDGVSYSQIIPQGANAGDYPVWYKVMADGNHKDTEPAILTAKIEPKEASVTVKCSPEIFPYDGTEKTPNVSVTYKEGDNDIVIPAGEYTVEFPQPRTAVKNGYTVTVKPGGNYVFTNGAIGTFDIVPASQAPLTIVTGKASTVYYGDTFRLSAVGGSGNGRIIWDIESEAAGIADIEDGLVTVNGIGTFTVTAYREKQDNNYDDSDKAKVEFKAEPKPVTAVVKAEDKVYQAYEGVKLTVTVLGSTVTATEEGAIKGEFADEDENVGNNKIVNVTIDPDKVRVTNGDKYDITYPATTTASIFPAPVTVTAAKPTANNTTYTGGSQQLVHEGGTLTGGSWAYSTDGIAYSLVIPTAKDAGDYTVWYMVRGDRNHTDSEAEQLEVTIGKAKPTIERNPVASSVPSGGMLKDSILTGGRAIFNGVEVSGTFTWTDSASGPLTETEPHDVSFTPVDRDNFEPVTEEIKITVEVKDPDDDGTGGNTGNNGGAGGSTGDTEPTTPGGGDTESGGTDSNTPNGGGDGSNVVNGGGGGSGSDGSANAPAEARPAESASAQTSVRNGTASTVLDTAAGNRLANEAVASGSKNVIIKPEITGDVTKTEVSIPASAMSRIGNETDAALTVSTPIADVTIPNGALDTLSSAGSTVRVVTEQVDNTVALTLTANGKDVGEVPGGLTLTVPAKDAGPGTVAVLVYEDGTRETIRRSVAENGGVRIPLNGSATVEIVDNSKEFADVPAESWAADAVAFASAHELFSGTGDGMFSPELSMSRAMLATVLYNLEGCPAQSLTGEFSDVSSDAWYAAGIAWAAANGITNGSGDGQFRPDDNVTREQFAVMLWRYMGSPASDGQTPDFTDTDQASSFAMEALRWATANGILNGHGNGYLDPGGMATRAQAAQLLKNFIENT